MKVFIADQNKTVTVRIYGLNGTEVTREFFSVFFLRVIEIHETTDEERRISGTDAEFTIDTYDHFKDFVGKIETIQQAIDDMSYLLLDGSTIDDYIIDDHLYAI